MKVSVIIPTYKPQKYLAECLSSLGAQTLDKKEFEIIIVLNGCCEPYDSLTREYISCYLPTHNVKYIQTDEPGVSNARNRALDIATGEYIAFIDDDDYVSPEYLEELLKNSATRCVALSDSIYFDDHTGSLDNENAHHNCFESLSNQKNLTLFQTRVFFNGPCMKLIHRDIIGYRRFDKRFHNGEDNLMMFLISDLIKHVNFTSSKAVYFRRIRTNSATTRKISSWKMANTSIKLCCQYIKYLYNNPRGYNYAFVLSRFAAEIKSTLSHFIN